MDLELLYTQIQALAPRQEETRGSQFALGETVAISRALSVLQKHIDREPEPAMPVVLVTVAHDGDVSVVSDAPLGISIMYMKTPKTDSRHMEILKALLDMPDRRIYYENSVMSNHGFEPEFHEVFDQKYPKD